MTAIVEVETKVYEGQKPGTSGLRKQVPEFTQPHYMENFIQCTLTAIDDLVGSTLVVGGDGRLGVKDATDKIIKIAAANGVSKKFLTLSRPYYEPWKRNPWISR